MEWDTRGAPDWRDDDRRVEVEYGDGRRVQGNLFIEDVIFLGDDEAPIYRVRADDGTEHSFVDYERWRFL